MIRLTCVRGGYFAWAAGDICVVYAGYTSQTYGILALAFLVLSIRAQRPLPDPVSGVFLAPVSRP